MRDQLYLLALCASLTVACGDKNSDTSGDSGAGSDDGGSADGGSSDGGGDGGGDGGADGGGDGGADGGADGGGDGGASGPNLEVSFFEFLSSAPLAGAEVTYGDQSATADANGTVSLEVPYSENVVFSLTLDGYRDTNFHRYHGSVPRVGSYSVASEATIATLASVLGLTIDPAKSIISVSVLDYDPDVEGASPASVPGATIDLDRSYDIALVLDSSSGTGISGGNTTLQGSGSTVIFVNVEAGAVTPTIATTNGMTCDVGFPSFDSVGNEYHLSTYLCSE